MCRTLLCQVVPTNNATSCFLLVAISHVGTNYRHGLPGTMPYSPLPHLLHPPQLKCSPLRRSFLQTLPHQPRLPLPTAKPPSLQPLLLRTAVQAVVMTAIWFSPHSLHTSIPRLLAQTLPTHPHAHIGTVCSPSRSSAIPCRAFYHYLSPHSGFQTSRALCSHVGKPTTKCWGCTVAPFWYINCWLILLVPAATCF